MASIELLTQDLTNLSLESKRRNHEIKNACSQAITQLKSLLLVQQIHDDQQKSILLIPFLLACKSDNIKLITIAIPAIHKLTIVKLIPILNLPDLLDGYLEATNLAMDVQLRILQNLPSLLTNYNDQFTGELLLKLLGICATLTANNKTTVVINTASATLQQLFSNVFDRDLATDDAKNAVVVDEDETIMVNDLAFERFQIFRDLCHLLNNELPTYFTKLIHINRLAVLEIIENIILNHTSLFLQHREMGFLLRQQIVPTLITLLNNPAPSLGPAVVSTSTNFPVYIRTMRIILVLLSSQLSNLEIEAEILLSYLSHLLLEKQVHDAKSTHVLWEQILVLEMYKSLFSNFNVIKAIFMNYDKNPKKKNVIQELTSILLVYIQNNSYLIANSVAPFAAPNSSPQNLRDSSSNTVVPLYLGRNVSNMKVSILDHLDKTEPPSSIPITYPVYLIYNILLAYADGISKFVQNLSGNDSNTASLEAEIEFINAFIEATYPHTSVLFQKFIYTRADSESFHLLIRSFQRFTHTTGLLGLGDMRDSLLLILAKAIIDNETSSFTSQKSLKDQGYMEQGKHLLALGEAIVESITGAELQPKGSGKQELNLKSRSINSRQVTCLRALSNLASSLGSTLLDSWKIIWITFQWCDYYINGPDEHSGYYNNKQYNSFTESMLPQLSPQDLQNFTIAEKKCIESISDYPPQSILELLSSLISLTSLALMDENAKEDESKTPIVMSPYNKTYFVNKLLQICKINPNRFFIESEKSWNIVVDHFIELATKRTMIYKLRIFFVGIFNEIINSVTREGFTSTNKDINLQTANSTLNALIKFLNGLFSLGPPQELLVANCEIEIHLSTLNTLRDLIDTYDTYYQNSWKQVFEIINTPFKFVKNEYEDNSTRDKIKSLINSAYETLKLILDEFVSTLPSDQLMFLIETLSNYSSQNYDLNISFLSVSYFWLISDSLKSRILELELVDIKDKLSNIEDNKDLLKILDTEDSNSYLYHIVLDLYLLTSLVEVCQNEQAQVRDGAIQTFFQILELHGDILLKSNSWDVIFKIGLPTLLLLKVEKNSEWLESLKSILTGFTSLYTKFEFDIGKWQLLIDYLNDLIALNWIELNLQVFQTFKDLLPSVTPDLLELLFNFWSGIEIEYDFINSSYQEYLATYMKCFPDLFKIVAPLNSTQLALVINSLHKCAMYPILPSNYNDKIKPSKIQQSILDNINVIKSGNNEGGNGKLIHFLANLITYPLSIRQRIETKFLNQNLLDRFQIPTFQALSHLSLRILRSFLEEYSDDDIRKLVEDKTSDKLFKSLLELVLHQVGGIDGFEWKEANEVINLIIEALMKLHESYDKETWQLIIQCITINFEIKQDDKAILRYENLVKIVLPNLIDTNNPEMIEQFIKHIYENSFLYEFNSVEKSLIEDDYEKTIDNFTEFNFEDTFGTTEPIIRFSNHKIRFSSLDDLISFCHTDNEDVNKICRQYLIRRLVICIRRYVTDMKLLYKCPITKLQQQELKIILVGLKRIDWDNADVPFKQAYRLLIELVPLVKNESIMEDVKTLLSRSTKY